MTIESSRRNRERTTPPLVDSAFYHRILKGYSCSTVKAVSEKIGGTAPRVLELTC
jgi:hypothetical protein